MCNNTDVNDITCDIGDGKPRVAFFDFASCEGCQLQIANLEEDILGLVECVDVVNFREVMKEQDDRYDIAFVEGAIERPMDEQRLKQIRVNAGILIALGACACTGGVTKLRNQWSSDDARAEVYGKHVKGDTKLFDLGMAKAIDEIVEVDFYIRGCPVRKEEVKYYVQRLLSMPPHKNLDLRFGVTSRNRPLDERSLVHYDPEKCVLCRRCDSTCNKALDIHAIGISGKGPESMISTPFDLGLDKNNCIHCGQCITTCPVGALYAGTEVERALALLKNPDNFVVFVIDPIGLTSCLGRLRTSEKKMGNILKKLVSAMRENGASKVVDFTQFIYLSSAAQAEFVRNTREPTFTSWCPSASVYIERFFPQHVKYLHKETSPETILLEVLESRYAGENIKVIMLTPCLAQKLNKSFDVVLMAQELPRLLSALNVQLDFFPSLGVTFNCDLGLVEKFITGGCSDYTCSLGILRAAYLGKFDNLEAALTVGTHDERVHELAFDSEEGFFNALVIEDLAKARAYLEGDIKKYNVIEIYPCFRGCLSGGGQFPTINEEEIKKRRTMLLDYKGEVESPFEFTAQMISVFDRLKGGE